MALALSAGFLLLFGAFTVLGEYALRGSERETRHEYLVIARMAAAQVEARIGHARADVQRTGDALAEAPSSADAQETLSADAGRAESIAAELAFLDASGQVIAIAPRGARLDPSLFVFPQQAAADATQPVSEPFTDPETGHPAVAIRVPVQRGGRAMGVLVGIVALDSAPMLEPLQQAVQLGQTGHAALIDSQGRIIVSTLGLPFQSTGEHPTFFQEVMAKRQDEVRTVPFALHLAGETTGEQHLMAAAMLQQVPWGVSLGGDVSEAFAPARHLRWGLVILGSLALVAIWGGSLWGTRLLVAPVYSLMHSATRIAGGDLTVPLEAGAGGEIGEMGEALEQMRQRLLQTIQSLEDLRATLEARVRERTEALRQQEAQVRRLLHQVITAQEEERARIAYELHDEVGQLLTAIRFSTDDLSAASLDGEAAAQITRVRELIDKAMADLRRLISGLRPGVIDQLGLLPALREVSEQILAPLDIAVTISGPADSRLPAEVEVVLFRIAQEAMHNIARHSAATKVELSVARGDGRIAMRIHDNGRGFDPAAVGPESGTGRGLGLAGMRERAALLGGWIRIDSAPGQGTSIEAEFPAQRADEQHEAASKENTG
jgi:signal transduction histidine kinase